MAAIDPAPSPRAITAVKPGSNLGQLVGPAAVGGAIDASGRSAAAGLATLAARALGPELHGIR